MRYPDFLKDGGTIGFVAPSFGCSIEPYKSAFENALKHFTEWGCKTVLGPNCFAAEGIGISNKPEKCGAELNEMYCSGESDVLISCGGGELMCEVVPYIDWEKIKSSRPKWYLGYSDNTNFTFLSATLADTAAIYGPCAPSFGMEPVVDSIRKAWAVLHGDTEVRNFPKWEKESLKDEEHPLLPYNMTEEYRQRMYLPAKAHENDAGKNGAGKNGAGKNGAGKNDVEVKGTGNNNTEAKRPVKVGVRLTDKGSVSFEGRLLGGCVDILILLCGTEFDKVGEFLERYKEDGFIWFLESCDLTLMSIRRAFFQMKHAGWFKYVKGFLIGRPLHFGEEMMGVDQYNAVTDIIGDLGVPILMDLDIGHLPPQMPLICGSYGKVEAVDNTIRIEQLLK